MELAALELAPQPDPSSRRQLLGQPFLVEPHGGDRVRVVLDPGGDDGQAATRTPNSDRAHHAGNRHLLLREQVGDSALGSRRLAAARSMLEQVADGVQPQPAQLRPNL